MKSQDEKKISNLMERLMVAMSLQRLKLEVDPAGEISCWVGCSGTGVV